MTQNTVSESLFGHCSQNFFEKNYIYIFFEKSNKMREIFKKMKLSKIKFLLINMI